MKALLIISVFCLAVLFNVSGQATPQEMLNKAIYQEEVNGNLDEAIKLFLEIVDKNSTNRAITVEAYYHLGLTNEKLGNKKAKEYYEKIVNSFGDQPEFVRIARERLSKLVSPELSKELAIRQLWTGNSVDDFGSVSADGEYLTFTDWSTGNLAVRNLITGQNETLTRDGSWKTPEQNAEFSLISPNGRQVAYIWFIGNEDNPHYELRLLQIGNPSPKVLYSCNKIEYIVPELWFSDERKFLAQKYTGKEKWELISVDINSGEFSIIKEKTPAPSGLPMLSLSPDEKQIAFDFPNLTEKGNHDIFIMSIDTKNESPLIRHPANDRLIGWIPGRNELLFTSDRSGTNDLWVVNTSNPKSPDVPKRIYANLGVIRPLGFRQDGSLFFGSHSTSAESFILPLDQSTGKISDSPRMIFPGQIFDICWLPDGESLACKLYISSQESNVAIYNSKTGESRILADKINAAGCVRISPDGKSVLVCGLDKRRSGEKDYAAGIYSIDIKTGIPTGLLIVKRDSDLISHLGKDVEWDKDGKWIFYTSNSQIIKHNIETGEEKILYAYKNLSAFTPTLRRSSDGAHLFFDGLPIQTETSKLKEGETYLLSIPEDGGEANILCNAMFAGTVNLKKISASPDGKYIYFSARTPEITTVIYRVPSAGGNPELIWQSKDYTVSGLSIHPDGKQIALSTSAFQNAISVVENLTRKVTDMFSKDK